jgi:hypothetical protein
MHFKKIRSCFINVLRYFTRLIFVILNVHTKVIKAPLTFVIDNKRKTSDIATLKMRLFFCISMLWWYKYKIIKEKQNMKRIDSINNRFSFLKSYSYSCTLLCLQLYCTSRYKIFLVDDTGLAQCCLIRIKNRLDHHYKTEVNICFINFLIFSCIYLNMLCKECSMETLN